MLRGDPRPLMGKGGVGGLIWMILRLDRKYSTYPGTYIMSTFNLNKEQLVAAAMEAIKNRCVELQHPLSDEDAQSLSALMTGGDVTDIDETKYNAILAQVAVATKDQLDMMLSISKSKMFAQTSTTE